VTWVVQVLHVTLNDVTIFFREPSEYQQQSVLPFLTGREKDRQRHDEEAVVLGCRMFGTCENRVVVTGRVKAFEIQLSVKKRKRI